jgi:3-oxoisoapionate-4-phosphate transcarboxylase/hydrolase
VSLSRITATYELVAREPEHAAQVLAGEGSTGTFVRVVGEDSAHVERFAITIDELTVTGPAGPQGGQPACLVVAVPDELAGGDLTTLLASVAGNVSEVAQVSSLRLVDLVLSASFARSCPRPRHGVTGTRALVRRDAGPLRGRRLPAACRTDADALRRGVGDALAAGAEIVLDPALAADPPAFPLIDRVAAVEPLLSEHRERSGHGATFLYAIDDEPRAMVAHAERIAAAGGGGALVSTSALGVSAVAYLRRRTDLVLAGRVAPGVAMSRSRRFSVADRVAQAVWRLAGIDHLPVGRNEDDPVTAVRDRLAPVLDDSDRALPVVAAPGPTGTDDVLVLDEVAAS